jgi:hypothetical protein
MIPQEPWASGTASEYNRVASNRTLIKGKCNDAKLYMRELHPIFVHNNEPHDPTP